VAPVDVDGDGYVDVIYAVDTRGNVWRINTSDPAAGFDGYAHVSDWPMQKIATVGQWGAGLSERRKFMYAPSVVVLGSQTTVLVGSGDREKPSAAASPRWS
jgi:type IV pilus assembly protein PilY1